MIKLYGLIIKIKKKYVSCCYIFSHRLNMVLYPNLSTLIYLIYHNFLSKWTSDRITFKMSAYLKALNPI